MKINLFLKLIRNYSVRVLFAVFTSSLVAAKSPEIPQDLRKELIDVHTHVACLSEHNGCYVNPKLKKSYKFKVYLEALGVTQIELEKAGDSLVAQRLSELVSDSKFVSKVVVLALDGYYDQAGKLDLEKTQVLVPNKFVLDQTKKFANLIYAPSIHPFKPNALKELEQAKSDGAIFVKWIPCIMNIDPASADSRMNSFYTKLKELKLPLLTHTGDEHSFDKSQNELCDPSRLQKPINYGVQVIAAHLGTLGNNKGENNLSRMEKMLATNPSLRFDISSLVNINKFNHIKYALKYPGRFYYGSDYPLIRAKLWGLPLNSSNYYRLKIPGNWRNFIANLTNTFDRDVALKLALGVPLEDLLRSKELVSKGTQ